METDLPLHCDNKLVKEPPRPLSQKVCSALGQASWFVLPFLVSFRSGFSFAGDEHDSRYPETRTEMYSFQLFREQPNQTTIFRGTKKRKKRTSLIEF